MLKNGFCLLFLCMFSLGYSQNIHFLNQNSIAPNTSNLLVLQVRHPEIKQGDSVFLSLSKPHQLSFISSTNSVAVAIEDNRAVFPISVFPSTQLAGSSCSFKAVITVQEMQLSEILECSVKAYSNYSIHTNPPKHKNQFPGDSIVIQFSISNHGNTAIISQLTSNVPIINMPTSIDTLLDGKQAEYQLWAKIPEQYQANEFHVPIRIYITNHLGETEVITKRFSVNILQSSIALKEDIPKFPITIEGIGTMFSSPLTNKTQYNGQVQIRGGAFLDSSQNHSLQVMFRVPNSSNLNRSQLNDVYFLKYQFQDQLSIQIGDIPAQYQSRLVIPYHGFGAELQVQSGNVLFGIRRTSSRLNRYLYDSQIQTYAEYSLGKFHTIGAEYIHTKNPFFIRRTQLPESIQSTSVLNSQYRFQHKKVQAHTEFGLDHSNQNQLGFGFASSVQFSGEKISFGGSATRADQSFFGSITNSFQYQTNFNIQLPSQFSIQSNYSSQSMLPNVDTLIQLASPNITQASVGIQKRWKQIATSQIRVQAKEVIQENNPISPFAYQEIGGNLSQTVQFKTFSSQLFSHIFYNQNLKFEGRKSMTYSAGFSITKSLGNKLNCSVSSQYLSTARYSIENRTIISVSGNIQYQIVQQGHLQIQYRTGFTPEEFYQNREYANANFQYRFSNQHTLRAHAQLYSLPGNIGVEQLYGLRYAIPIKIPLKRIETATINGTVDCKNPLLNQAGIRVWINHFEVYTNHNGQFQLSGLPYGEYRVVIDPSSLPNGVSILDNTVQKLNISSSNQKISFQCVETGQLSVQISKEDMQMLNRRGVQVEILVKNETISRNSYIQTNGVVQFPHLEVGQYEIKVAFYGRNAKRFEASIPNHILQIEQAQHQNIQIDIIEQSPNIQIQHHIPIQKSE